MQHAGRLLGLPERLSDDVILLDGHVLADAEAHLAGEDAEMLLRFEAPHAATLDQTRAAIGRWIAARSAGGPMFAYAVRNAAGELVGGCELRLAAPDSADVSYWVFPAFRGQGYARRALTLLCQAAAKLDEVCWAEAHIDADNLASRRAAERAGFVETGVVHHRGPSGALVPRVLYTLALKPELARYSGQRPTPPS
ncbi:GNAT family N-acetyltransferase [Phenylobacterium sp. 58.2.17]|uniref:GNAT family N-acetyltransferase n=1 Tax=Phenylobacterium sp. 58.2.17 TaxID=2969306 RepID=UPI002264AB07|nr:GNAT family N-acetyltransferase [Phenylobacterium sp. 58.2.17]MCX7585459.1 GNAT family N-acetyltransferase [Phenylobacterium sp. 58.2.17]